VTTIPKADVIAKETEIGEAEIDHLVLDEGQEARCVEAQAQDGARDGRGVRLIGDPLLQECRGAHHGEALHHEGLAVRSDAQGALIGDG